VKVVCVLCQTVFVYKSGTSSANTLLKPKQMPPLLPLQQLQLQTGVQLPFQQLHQLHQQPFNQAQHRQLDEPVSPPSTVPRPGQSLLQVTWGILQHPYNLGFKSTLYHHFIPVEIKVTVITVQSGITYLVNLKGTNRHNT